jgi:hypothetical protein
VNGKSIDELIKSCDKDGNGIIDYNEFKAAMIWEVLAFTCKIMIKIKQTKYCMYLFID